MFGFSRIVVTTMMVIGTIATTSCLPGGQADRGNGERSADAGSVTGSVRYSSADDRYVFPVASEIETMEWTEYHWDGSNAVDIFAASELPADSPELLAFRRAPVLAVADGTARRIDNERGGIAILLQADDGRQFYYSHLSDAEFSDERRVDAGEPIGRIGDSGRWSRYIEPHLHFEVVDEWTDGLGWSETVNAARWIRRHFGFRWIDRRVEEYPPDAPAGRPVDGVTELVRSFADLRAENRDSAGLEIAVSEASGVLSVVTGEVTVMRATKLGLRVQVTNRHTEQTVVYSGLADTDVRTGEVAEPGDRIGTVDDVLHVQYFDDGVLRDPLSVMDL